MDSDDQIVDLAWASKAAERWLATGGNVRTMHNPSLYPAGVGVAIDVKSDGVYLTADIVEPTAKRLVEKGVLRAFSVGIGSPKIVRDRVAKGGRIVDGELVEVSIVDRPANPACAFSLAKSVGAELVKTQEFTVGNGKEVENEEIANGENRTEGIHPKDESPRVGIVGKRAEPDIAPESSGGKSQTPESVTKGVGDPVSEGREGDFPQGTEYAYTDSEGGKHLPLHDKEHVQNAMARWSQTNFETASDKRKAAKRIVSAAKDNDIDVDPDTDLARAAASKSAHAANARVATAEIKRAHDLLCPAVDYEIFKSENPKLVKNGVAAALGPSTRQALWTMLDNEVDEDGGSGACAYDIENIAEAYCGLTSFIQSEAYEEVSDALGLSVRAELKKDRQFYTHAAKDDVRAKLGQLHSILATIFPDICSDEQGDLAEAQATETNAELDDARVSDTKTDAVAPDTTKASEDSSSDDGGDADSSDGGSDSDASKNTPPPPKKKGKGKGKKGKSGKKTKFAELVKSLREENEKQRVQIERLAAAPDMSKAPKRAPAYAANKSIAVDEVRKSEQQAEVDARVNFLRSLARGGTGEQQHEARAELARLGVTV